MIIFGTQERLRSVGNGSFHCPGCGAQRQYDRKKHQLWFTLYFVPVVPIDTYSEHVECRSCSQGFDVAVLTANLAQSLTTRDEHVANLWRSTMIAVAGAFGRPNAGQAAAIDDGLAKYWSMPSEIAAITEDCGWVPAAGVPEEALLDRVMALAALLGHAGKENFLLSANDVIRGGAAEAGRQQQLLAGIGKALGMSQAHIRSVLS